MPNPVLHVEDTSSSAATNVQGAENHEGLDLAEK